MGIRIKNKWQKLIILLALPIILGAIGALILMMVVGIMRFPIDLSRYQPYELTKVYDINGELISKLSAEKRELISLDKLPEYLPNATLAIEDAGFYSHKGIRLKAIVRAFVQNVKTRSLSQGGSTISQQLAKNMTNRAEKKIIRKIKEALFTIKIEKTYTKNQILELYLNQINYGYGNYGVALAAKAYFGKTPEELTLAESALLSGIPQRPNYYYPPKHLDLALKRQRVVLKEMLKYNFITKEEYDNAKKEKIIIKQIDKKERFAPYFIDYLIKQLVKKYGYETTFNGGLKVYTTIRKNVQESLEKTMSSSKYQGGMVVVDPKTGGILGMVGGRNYKENKFNRTTQARRQCGSAFKVFLYTTYIKYRIGTLADLWYDTPIHFPQLEGAKRERKEKKDKDKDKKDKDKEKSDEEEEYDSGAIYKLIGWVPSNYSGFRGPSIVYDGIIRSINIIAIKVLLATGIKEVIETAHKMGIKSYLKPIVSLPLGANEVSPLEMATAFSPLANGGYRVESYSIVKVEDQMGRVLERNFPIKTKVLDEQTVYVMDWVLKKVVAHGTGMRARIKGYPIAGKTGTTNNFTDAWFLGFTPNYVGAVFLGNDDPSVSLGYNKTGGAIAAPLWRKAMKPILTREVPIDFKMPTDIKFLNIDRAAGTLTTSQTQKVIKLPFVEGTEIAIKKKEKREDILWNNLKGIQWIK